MATSRKVHLTTLLLIVGVVATSPTARSEPFTTAFTYQAQLQQGAAPMNGSADFRFTLHAQPSGGPQVAPPLLASDVLVTNGLVNFELDFGVDVFEGSARWLQVEIRAPHDPSNTLPYTMLNPRQRITPTPYALQCRGIFVNTAGHVSIPKRFTVTAETSETLAIQGDATAPNGEAIGIRGTTLSPDGSGIEGTGPNEGICGKATAPIGPARGVCGTSASMEGEGVMGHAMAPSGATTGVMGMSESPDGIGVKGMGGAEGLHGEATETSGATTGVMGMSASPDGTGVVGMGGAEGIHGVATEPTGATTGVMGMSASPDGTGVVGMGGAEGLHGEATALSGATTGVMGMSASPDGTGVVGMGGAEGIHGVATEPTGATTGVMGMSASPDGTGVVGMGGAEGLHGEATEPTGVTTGVMGISASPEGTGVTGMGGAEGIHGVATEIIGATTGVMGMSASPDGTGVKGMGGAEGVHGETTETSGTAHGVCGISASTEGVGVLGRASAATGTTYGVHGMVDSPTGYAGYFEGRGYFSGNVGVGMTDPQEPLDVSGNIHASGTIASGSSITIDGANVPQTLSSSDAIEFHIGGNRALRIEPELQGTGTDTVSPNILGGWQGNTIAAGVSGATIAGGGGENLLGADYPNAITGHHGTIGGGARNTGGHLGTVGGGFGNIASGGNSTIAGGYTNTASGIHSSIGGGNEHAASGYASTIGGGQTNVASGDWATVAGGSRNQAGGHFSFAAGRKAKVRDSAQSSDADGDEGTFVWADSTDADFASSGANQFLIRTAGGVGINTNSPTDPLTVNGVIRSVTGGFEFPDGTLQTTAAGASTTWGLTGNAGTSPGTNFLGTTDNQAFELHVNSVRALRIEPTISTPNVIGGFSGNTVTAGKRAATIGGGGDSSNANLVTDYAGTVGGGVGNSAGNRSTVSGGWSNNASGSSSNVAGGQFNAASGSFSMVGGGHGNAAIADRSIVPGGASNTAGGEYSLAAGRRAKIRDSVGSGDADGDNGTFVWADSTDADFASTGPNQFLVRASGGIYLGSNSTVSIPAGTFLNTSTGGYLTTGGVWTDSSDRDAKENFEPLDSRSMLDRLADIPITRWNFKAQDPSVQHIGPVAQDFHAVFGTGEDDRHLAPLDTAGVALAGIQGLYEIVREKDCEIGELQDREAAKDQRIVELEARLAAIEAFIARSSNSNNGGAR